MVRYTRAPGGKKAQTVTSGTVQIPRQKMIESIARLRSEQADPVIVNLIGIHGTGKTVVLSQLYDTFASKESVIWLDFAPQQSLLNQMPPQALDAVVAHLNEQVEALEYLSIEQVPADDSDIDAISPPQRDVQVSLQISTDSIDIDSPLLVLLDHIDALHAWRWIQTELLSPLTEQPVFFVCASRDQLSWDYWRLRDWCQVIEMQPFTPDEAAAYFEQQGACIIPTTIIPRLVGEELYPYTLQEELREFKKRIGDWPVPASVVLPIDTLPASDPLLYYCGWLRALHIEVILELLTMPLIESAPDLPADLKERHSLLAALTRWRNAGYIHVNDLTERLIQSLRQELEQHVHENDPERYQTIVAHVADVYYERTRQGSTTSDITRSFLEWLYYSTTVCSIANEKETYAKWETQLVDLMKDIDQPIETLVLSLYHDQEVVRLLNAAGLLHTVDRYFQTSKVTDSVTLTPEQRKHKQAIQERILASWNNTPILDIVRTMYPGGVTGLLADIYSITTSDGHFDIAALRRKMQQHGLSQQTRHRIIRSIQEVGLVQYHRDTEQFALDSAARKLLSGGRYDPGLHNPTKAEEYENDSTT